MVCFRSQLRTAWVVLLTMGVLCWAGHGAGTQEPHPRRSVRTPAPASVNSDAASEFTPLGGKMSPPERAALLALTQPPLRRHATPPARVTTGRESYAVLNLEFTDAAAQRAFVWPAGLTPFTRFERFADAFLRLDPRTTPDLVRQLETAPDLVWLELAQNTPVTPPAPVQLSRSTAKSPKEKIVRGGWPVGAPRYTGRGVIIAVVDTGLDFRNPDFITCDADGAPVSRLLWFWDTTQTPPNAATHHGYRAAPPVSYPNGAPFGAVYTRNDLNAALRTDSRARKLCPGGAPASQANGADGLAQTDSNGHGTAVAGVAAGNGNNAPSVPEVVGVAPQADLIAVRAGADLSNAFLLNAAAGWLDTVAGMQPLVVTASFNTNGGGYDGASIAERQLDARFPSAAVGRALVVSAGNYQARSPETETRHAALTLAGSAQPAKFVFANLAPDAELTIYLNGDAPEDVVAETVPASLAQLLPRPIRWRNPLTGHAVLSFQLPKDLVGLTLSSTQERTLRADAYLQRGAFVSVEAETGYLVEKPGTAGQALTVGSYDWNEVFPTSDGLLSPVPCEAGQYISLGRISYNSRRGPRRDGVMKPDLAAPGQFYRASYALNSGFGVVPPSDLKTKAGGNKCPDFAALDETGRYALFDGTSAATAYTAGLVALLFEKKPSLTWGEMRDVVRRHLTTNPQTGSTPNPAWGYGKLDLAAVERMMAALE